MAIAHYTSVIRMAGRCRQGPTRSMFPTLKFIYWLYLLSAPHPTIAATSSHVPTDYALDQETTSQPLAETTRTEEVQEKRTIPMNRTAEMAWALGFDEYNGYSCEYNCGFNLPLCCMLPCSCDKLCRLHNDCCPDFEDKCPREAGESITEVQMQNHSYFMSYLSQDDLHDDLNIKQIEWIRTCPKGADQVLAQKCEGNHIISRFNLLLHTPVLQDGFMFKNKYCAICHGLTKVEKFIDLAIVCVDDGVTDQIKKDFAFKKIDNGFASLVENECKISHRIDSIISPYRRFIKMSYIAIKSDCPGSELELLGDPYELELANMCRSYYARVIVDGTPSIKGLDKDRAISGNQFIYNNPHCALCNGVILNGTKISSICSLYECFSYICFGPECVGYGSGSFSSFAILVDVEQSEDTEVEIVKLSDGKCIYGNIADDLSETCRSVQCPIGLIPEGESCSAKYNSVPQLLEGGDNAQGDDVVSTDLYVLHTLVFFGDSFPDDYEQALSNFTDKIKYMPFLSQIESIEYDKQCSSVSTNALVSLPLGTERNQSVGCFIIKFNLWKLNKITTFVFYEIEYVGYEIQSVYESFNITGIFLLNYNISKVLECTIGREIISNKAVLYSVGEVQNVFVGNVGYTWPTSLIPLSIYLPSFYDSQVMPLQLSVRVCISDIDPENDNLLFSNTQELITFIGNAVSVFALLLGLLSLSLAPQLKVSVRVILINLTLALTIAQSTFLLQGLFGLHELVCRVMGIFQHYAWLAYFFMMNAAAIEMAWGFRSLTAMVETIYKGRLAGLLLHGWFSPFILVIPSVILNQVENHVLNPHYGKNEVCWLNNPKALLYFFVIPFCVIIGTNTILILFAIIAMKGIAAPPNTSSQERSYLHVNIKLSTLMGLSWLLGLVASYTKVDALWYVFIILNTLQGVILFFAFGWPIHAIRYFKSRLSSSK